MFLPNHHNRPNPLTTTNRPRQPHLQYHQRDIPSNHKTYRQITNQTRLTTLTTTNNESYRHNALWNSKLQKSKSRRHRPHHPRQQRHRPTTNTNRLLQRNTRPPLQQLNQAQKHNFTSKQGRQLRRHGTLPLLQPQPPRNRDLQRNNILLNAIQRTTINSPLQRRNKKHKPHILNNLYSQLHHYPRHL